MLLQMGPLLHLGPVITLVPSTGPAELRTRKHENKTGGNRPVNFSCAFCFRVFPTIREPGTGYTHTGNVSSVFFFN